MLYNRENEGKTLSKGFLSLWTYVHLGSDGGSCLSPDVNLVVFAVAEGQLDTKCLGFQSGVPDAVQGCYF